MRSRSILVPHDGSALAAVALPVARTMARIVGATLHILHVAESRLSPGDLLATVGLLPGQLGEATLNQAAGDPAETILETAVADGSFQIIMGSGTGSQLPERPLGHVAEAVLLGAPCPVVVVRPERGLAPWALGRILLPHDGTPTTAEAFAPVASLAELAGAELDVLHVSAIADRPTETGSLAAPRYLDQAQHEWPAWVEEFMGRLTCLGCMPAGLSLRLLMARGKPGDEILRVARVRQADLIALAWHGCLGSERATVLKAILAAAPCPILVLRTGSCADRSARSADGRQ